MLGEPAFRSSSSALHIDIQFLTALKRSNSRADRARRGFLCPALVLPRVLIMCCRPLFTWVVCRRTERKDASQEVVAAASAAAGCAGLLNSVLCYWMVNSDNLPHHLRSPRLRRRATDRPPLRQAPPPNRPHRCRQCCTSGRASPALLRPARAGLTYHPANPPPGKC